jgi:MoaA/NifB/PqqE/SkfB family radical SAM enzyme
MSASDGAGRMSFRRRLLGMIHRNPNMVKTFARTFYRHEIGARLDSRSTTGHAAPPVRIKINVTRSCNLQCRMCIQDRKDTEKDKFPWNDPANQLPLTPWVHLLDQAASFHPLIALTGGEPLLYPYFREFITAAKERNFVVELVTNGTLLRREAEFLVEKGVEFIIVSIDGPEEVHDEIRGVRGSFRKSLAGVAALQEARRKARAPGPLVSLNCVLSKTNLSRGEEMMPLAENLGVDVLNYLHTIFDSPANVERHNRIFSEEWAKAHGLKIVTPSKPEGEYYETEIGTEDMPALRELMQKVQRRSSSPMMVNFSPNLSREKLDPYYLDLGHPFTSTCKCLWTDCRILPDGSVIPCLHVQGGNISRGPFMEVWNCPEIQNFRRIIAKGLFPGCARCCCRKY